MTASDQMTFAISRFKNKFDKVPQNVMHTWEEICEEIAHPLVRAEKDGPLFSPAVFDPPVRHKANVAQLSLLVVDYDHLSSLISDLGLWHARGICFAVHTTHSHLRVTDKNPKAEERFRLIIPLSEPIPASLYPALWQWAYEISGGKIDTNAKDESRLFYLPAKASSDAPYERRIVNGNLLDWRTLELDREIATNHCDSNSAGSNGSSYANWPALKAELGRRIMARGKKNSAGNWDAQARCHNGKGPSGVFYNPLTSQTICNAGCDEATILRTEGLPKQPDGNTTQQTNSQSDSESYCEQSWSPPVLFYEYNLPAFPTDVLPKWLREFVEAEAIATQTPVDLATMLSLSILGAVCAKKIVVQIRPGWREPTNIFTVTVLPPANRKTTVFSDVTRPLTEREAELAKEMSPLIAEADNKKRILETRMRKLQSRAAKAKPDARMQKETEAAALARELSAMNVPTHPRLIAEDCSPERLATLLRDQGGRMAVLSAEGDVFDLLAGRYSSNNAPNFGVYLKGHAGDDLRVDRVGRPPEFVKNPALTVGLAVQPDVLRGLIDKPGFRGRGLLGRFLYSLPLSLLGRRITNPKPMSDTVQSEYNAKVRALALLAENTDEYGNLSSRMLKLSSGAEIRLLEFQTWIEPQLAEFGELGSMTDWAGKLAGAVARIGGILHMAERAESKEPWQEPISEETIKQAIRIGKYLIPHARAAFSEMGTDPVAESAKYVLRWIERTEKQSFTKRDAFEGTKGRFKQVTALEPALQLLAAHGHIREQAQKARDGAGRKPSPIYDVNPLVYSHNSQYSQFSKRAENTANYANTANQNSSQNIPPIVTNNNLCDSESQEVLLL